MWCTPPNSAKRARAPASSCSLGTPGGVGETTNQRTCTLPGRGPSTGVVAPRSPRALGSSGPVAASSQISKSPPVSGSPITDDGPPSMITTDFPDASSPVITRRMASLKADMALPLLLSYHRPLTDLSPGAWDHQTF